MNEEQKSYINDLNRKIDEIQQERFLSERELFESLGFTLSVDQGNSMGWYKGKRMTWDRYLYVRYCEDHPDDPNIKYHKDIYDYYFSEIELFYTKTPKH